MQLVFAMPWLAGAVAVVVCAYRRARYGADLAVALDWLGGASFLLGVFVLTVRPLLPGADWLVTAMAVSIFFSVPCFAAGAWVRWREAMAEERLVAGHGGPAVPPRRLPALLVAALIGLAVASLPATALGVAAAWSKSLARVARSVPQPATDPTLAAETENLVVVLVVTTLVAIGLPLVSGVVAGLVQRRRRNADRLAYDRAARAWFDGLSAEDLALVAWETESSRLARRLRLAPAADRADYGLDERDFYEPVWVLMTAPTLPGAGTRRPVDDGTR